VLLSPEAVGKIRGVVEKSNDAFDDAVKVAAIWLSSVRPLASPHRSLELSTKNSVHGGFTRQPRRVAALRAAFELALA
jgi:hypothetical protein